MSCAPLASIRIKKAWWIVNRAPQALTALLEQDRLCLARLARTQMLWTWQVPRIAVPQILATLPPPVALIKLRAPLARTPTQS